jgi:quercetin dioxygenase-like cupin family protein
MGDSNAHNALAGLEAAKAFSLAGLAQAAKDTIASRILLKTSQGSVTLFSFDRGQALSEHTAPFHALVQVLEGSVELTIGGKPVMVEAGETALMPADVPHAVRAAEPLKMLLVMMRPWSFQRVF